MARKSISGFAEEGAAMAQMDRDSDRCALELSDARVDVLGYACLVAIMSMGKGYHRESETRLHRVTRQNDAVAPVVTSAGALIHGLKNTRGEKDFGDCPVHETAYQHGVRVHRG